MLGSVLSHDRRQYQEVPQRLQNIPKTKHNKQWAIVSSTEDLHAFVQKLINL